MILHHLKDETKLLERGLFWINHVLRWTQRPVVCGMWKRCALLWRMAISGSFSWVFLVRAGCHIGIHLFKWQTGISGSARQRPVYLHQWRWFVPNPPWPTCSWGGVGHLSQNIWQNVFGVICSLTQPPTHIISHGAQVLSRRPLVRSANTNNNMGYLRQT